MRYTLKYITRNMFYYPCDFGAYNDFGIGQNPSGSYLVLHLTTRLADALFYDTPEEAECLSEFNVVHSESADEFTEPDYGSFELLGVIEVSEKKIFKLKLK